MELSVEEAEVKRAVDSALGGMLEELAYFCITHSIRFVELERLLRAKALKVSREYIESSGSPVSLARLQEMTGLPAFFVEEALARLEDESGKRLQVFQGSDDLILDQLGLTIHTWSHDPRFTVFAGVPLDLPVSTTDSPDRKTFSELLGETAKGVDLQDALRVLQDTGVASLIDDGRMIKLVNDAISYRNARARSIVRYGRVVGGLMRTLRHNRDRRHLGETPLYERSLITDRPISDANEAEFRDAIQSSGDRWLRTVDADQTTYAARTDEPGQQWGLTVFLFEIPDSKTTGNEAMDEIDLLKPVQRMRRSR